MEEDARPRGAARACPLCAAFAIHATEHPGGPCACLAVSRRSRPCRTLQPLALAEAVSHTGDPADVSNLAAEPLLLEIREIEREAEAPQALTPRTRRRRVSCAAAVSAACGACLASAAAPAAAARIRAHLAPHPGKPPLLAACAVKAHGPICVAAGGLGVLSAALGSVAAGCLLGVSIAGGVAATRAALHLPGAAVPKPGQWCVVTEEGCWHVVSYPFDSEADARAWFAGLWRARVLLDGDQREVEAGGSPLAWPTIRAAASSLAQR